MSSLPVHKGTLHYELHGPEGAPFILVLPGAATAPWQYDGVRARLSREFRVITFDYRGTGQSTNDMWTVTPNQLAQDALILLDAIGAEEAHAVAISLGTFVLSDMLQAAPGRIDRCVLAGLPALRRKMAFGPIGAAPGEDTAADKSSSGGPATTGPQDARSKALAGMISSMFVSPEFRREQPERYHEMLRRMTEVDLQLVWASMQQFYGVFGYDWRRTRIFETLGRGRRLLLTGDQDAFAPLRDLPEHPIYRAGPTVVFRGAGHFFFYERAEAFDELVAHFLRSGRVPRAMPEGTSLLQAPPEVGA